MKKIDLYLMKSFFTSLLVVTLSFTLIIIIINVIEELRDFVDHEVPLVKIAEYYFYWCGWVLKSFLAMFILIATLFSVSILARHKEVLAMKASGLSLYRMALPYLVVTLLLAAGHFYYNEYIFPPANKRRLEIKQYTIEKHSRASDAQVSNIYRQVRPGYFYTMSRFNADRMEGRDLKVYVTENDVWSELSPPLRSCIGTISGLLATALSVFFLPTPVKHSENSMFSSCPISGIIRKTSPNV